jgi:putative membrane protein
MSVESSEHSDVHPEHGHVMAESDALPLPTLVLRGSLGGILMGLANLVPGISGGTMLLAAGVYPTFISSIADLTTLRFKLRSIVALCAIGGSAAVAILLLAGTLKMLVVEQRWVMYSLFIGLTLGGVPLVWRLARPATPGLILGGIASFLLMVLMSLGSTATGSEDASFLLLALSGLAGASAMILPGVSGGYLLLLLGQYEPILGAIDTLKLGLLGSATTGFDLDLVLQAMTVVVPVGIGVVIGIVGVSNLLSWLLDRYEKATLGILLGLLLGSVVGLYPFQKPVPPDAGFVYHGHALTDAEAAELEEKNWPLQRFGPDSGEVGTALALILAGLGATLLIDRIGGKEEPTGEAS